MESLLHYLRLTTSSFSSSTTHSRDSPTSSGSPRRDSNEEDYELLLPHHSQPNGYRRRRKSTKSRVRSCLHHFTLRKVLLGLCIIPLFLLCGLLWGGIPPSFNDVREFERHLPQHIHANSSTPEDDGRMFLRFPGHLWGHGLNNILQEAILHAHLAHLTKRTYVFEDYVWSRNPAFLPGPYTIYDGRLRPKRVPLNAFTSGALAGGRVYSSLTSPSPSQIGTDNSQGTRIAVSAEYYTRVCANQKVTRIPTNGSPSRSDGQELLNWWVDRLNREKDVRCVEIVEGEDSPRAFDMFLFGSARFLSIYSSMATSPVLRDFAWSPLVQSALARAWTVLKPYNDLGVLYDFLPPSISTAEVGTVDDLVAVHLRRGDYKRHCPRLAKWRSTYLGMNQHPDLPDRFDWEASVASLSLSEVSEDEREKAIEAYYLQHCLPTPEQVVATLRRVRGSTTHKLKRVYILTNGWSSFFSHLRSLLMADGWDEVIGSIDVQASLDGMQEWVGMAVDMAVAEKAGVFVGNGFSSLSANIIMLRMSKGAHADTNRFL